MATNIDSVMQGAAIHSIAVIGAGVHGRAFARRCLDAGHTVTLEDVLSSNLRRAEQALGAKQLPQGGKLRLAGSVEDAVREADLAIDFVPDELESKLEIFSMMDRMAPPRTIFLTPTRLNVSDLASCTYRAAQCLALRPFEEHMGELELVAGVDTEDDVLRRVAAWFERLGSIVQVSRELSRELN